MAALQRSSADPPSQGIQGTCPAQQKAGQSIVCVHLPPQCHQAECHQLCDNQASSNFPAKQHVRQHSHKRCCSCCAKQGDGHCPTFLPTIVQPRMHWSWKQCLHSSCTVDSAPQARPCPAQPCPPCCASSLALTTVPKSRSSPLQMPHALVDTAMRFLMPIVAACIKHSSRQFLCVSSFLPCASTLRLTLICPAYQASSLALTIAANVCSPPLQTPHLVLA